MRRFKAHDSYDGRPTPKAKAAAIESGSSPNAGVAKRRKSCKRLRTTNWSDISIPEREVIEAVAEKRIVQKRKGLSRVLGEIAKGFPFDFYLLRNGHNLLYFGLGSKQNVLELFAQSIRQFEESDGIKPSCVMMIGGSSAQGSTGKNSIDALHEGLKTILEIYLGLSCDDSAGMLVERASSKICSSLAVVHNCRILHQEDNRRRVQDSESIPLNAPAWERDLYLFVHSIDSEIFCDEKAKEAIVRLAEAPGIHLVASVDHVHAPLLWSFSQGLRLRFVHRKVDTFMPYVHETKGKRATLSKQVITSTGAMFVLKSLTQNHKDVLKILAEHQLDKNPRGMRRADLYEQCSNAMFVNSRDKLDRLMVEFKDHEIVAVDKRDAERLYIKWPNSVIRETVL